jgi:hypothetical protein
MRDVKLQYQSLTQSIDAALSRTMSLFKPVRGASARRFLVLAESF